MKNSSDNLNISMEAHSVIDENNYAFPLRLESDKEDGQGLNESGL